ncbi:hypothetical protein [Brevirhabdus sp.]|uniref:hypothetical protein n=1 Tax=Brevirhabdus sp. TaxID=2004514 RepID=UPI00405A2533
MISELADGPVSEWRTKALIREHVRGAMAEMRARQEAPADETESRAYLDDLEGKKARIVVSYSPSLGQDLA